MSGNEDEKVKLKCDAINQSFLEFNNAHDGYANILTEEEDLEEARVYIEAMKSKCDKVLENATQWLKEK